MQGPVQALCKLGGIIGPVQEIVYVGGFVCPCEQVVHIPHGYYSIALPLDGEIFILIE